MSCHAGDGRETKVGEASPPILVNQDIRLRGKVRDVQMLTSRESRTPFRSP